MRVVAATCHLGAIATAALLPLLAACNGGMQSAAPPQPGKSAAGATRTFTSKSYGIAISYPADFHAVKDFPGHYLANGAWKVYAGPKSRGQPIVALVLANSNEVTDAELRIGASRDAQAVRDCTQAPDAVRPKSERQVRLDGVDFTTFEAGDAAMSHYLATRSYRAVHAGACYAIDLIVFGTNPEVYDPPRTPPFTREQAFAHLQQALQGFRFTH